MVRLATWAHLFEHKDIWIFYDFSILNERSKLFFFFFMLEISGQFTGLL